MYKNRKSIGIIGFGRFGQLAAKHLKKHFTVFVGDYINKREDARKIGVAFASVEECASKDIVLLCVPISNFEEVLRNMVPFLKKGAIVVDVCSVKEEPVKTMKKLVPKECEFIGTHPLFGPDSTKNGLKGKKIVLCPIRTRKLASIKNFLEKLGLHVMEGNPEEHDKQMAKSLTLSYFIGKVLVEMDIEKVEMTTPTHGQLIGLANIVRNDSEQLFVDMQTHNRFARKTRKALIEELIKIDEDLNAQI